MKTVDIGSSELSPFTKKGDIVNQFDRLWKNKIGFCKILVVVPDLCTICGSSTHNWDLQILLVPH